MARSRKRSGNKPSNKFVDNIAQGRYHQQVNWWWKFYNRDIVDSDYNRELELEYIRREIKYISNFYQFSDKNLQKHMRAIVYNAYFYGKVGIVPIKDEYSIYTLSKIKYNDFNQIISGSGYITQFAQGIPSKNTYSGISSELNNVHHCLSATDEWNLPWYFFLERHINEFKDINISKKINRINSRSLKAIINNNQAFNNNNKIEIETLHSSENPINVVSNITGEVLDLSLANQSETINKDWNETYKNYCLARGFRDNLDRKTEKNLTDELQNADIPMEVIENDRKLFFEDIAQQLSKITGKNITVSTIIDIRDNKELEQKIKLKEAEPDSEIIEAEAKEDFVEAQIKSIENDIEQSNNSSKNDKEKVKSGNKFFRSRGK